MSPPQEGRYTKISAIATVVALILGYLAWQYPKQPRSAEAEPPKTSEVHPGTDFDSHHSSDLIGAPRLPSPASTHSGTDSPSTRDPQAAPPWSRRLEGTEKGDAPSGSTGSRKSRPKCGVPETTILRPGAPARVASGLAILSVKTAREGSEPYLTLGIASDRDTLTEAVLGAPARFHFKSSLGAYFVNVVEADLAAGAITVQVGCEAEGNTP